MILEWNRCLRRDDQSITDTVVNSVLANSGSEDIRVVGFFVREIVEFVSLSRLNCCSGCGDLFSSSCCHLSIPSHLVGEKIHSVGNWNSPLSNCLVKKSSGFSERQAFLSD